MTKLPTLTMAVAPTVRWLTDDRPAAIAVVAVPCCAGLLDRPWPAVGCARFARVRSNSGADVDEVVAWRLDETHGEIHGHGGSGARAALMAAFASHHLASASTLAANADAVQDLEAEDHWSRLASVRHPAAVVELLRDPDAHRHLRWARRLPTVLITGPANAGKSTLLNAWCGHHRAVVSAQPGTTRDLVGANALTLGWRLRLIDSAGLRPTADPLEQAGQRLITAARTQADMVVALLPLDRTDSDDSWIQSSDVVVHGKVDRATAASGEHSWPLPWSIHGWNELSAAALLEKIQRAVLARLQLRPLDQSSC